ncbi:MAG: tetratricopeptide repeat protein [Bacteroidota bacterium]
MSHVRAFNPFVVLSFGLLIATGCNAFEFMHDEESNDPDVLLDDARIAMQNGDPEKAVDFLEKALEKAPENPEIRIELSAALFQSNEIDLLVMKDLAEFISDDQNATHLAGGIAYKSPPACNFRDEVDTTIRIDFDIDPAYLLLLDNEEVLQRAVSLLSSTLESEAAQALTDHVRSNAHLMRAIANMATSIIEIKQQADAAEASLHRLRSGNIGYCAANDAALAQLETFILCEKLPVIDEAVADLVNRQALFSTGESELADAVATARTEISSAITRSCQVSG